MRRIERRYHLNWSGVAYFLATAFLGLGAVNSQNNLLFILLGVALSGIVVSGLVSGPMMYRLRVEREPVGELRVGTPARLAYRVTQTGRMIAGFAITVEEVEHAGLGKRADWPSAISSPRAFAPHIPCGKSVHVTAPVVPIRRGVFRLEGVRAHSAFPSGLFRKSVSYRQREEAVVRPRVVALRPDRLRALLARGASDRTTRGGQRHGTEFFGVRPYTAGDSPRQIAWRASARSDTLVAKEYAAQASGRLTVVLLVEGTLEARAHDERAIVLAASLIDLAQRQLMAVGLQVPALGVLLRPASGARHVSMLHEALARLDLDQASTERDGAGASPAARSSVVVVRGRRIEHEAAPRARAGVIFADQVDEILHAEALPTPEGSPAPVTVVAHGGGVA